MLIVQKFGGSSVADGALVQRAARRTAELVRQGHRVVTVVSAQGHTTDQLLALAQSVAPEPSFRESDSLLAAGEQISAALMAMALEDLGTPAISLTGWQAGLQTDAVHGNAHILGLTNDRIHRELAKGKAVVVAGFQGLCAGNDVTTLGRGGSDTTAVALAAAKWYQHSSVEKRVCVVASTASPYKFSPAVLEALGGRAPEDGFEALRQLQKISGVPAPARLAALEQMEDRFTAVVQPADMKKAVLSFADN
jgi:aspartate kinase